MCDFASSSEIINCSNSSKIIADSVGGIGGVIIKEI